MLLTSAVSRECGHFPQCFYISQRLSFSPEFCKPSKAREDVGRTVTLEKGKKKRSIKPEGYSFSFISSIQNFRLLCQVRPPAGEELLCVAGRYTPF